MATQDEHGHFARRDRARVARSMIPQCPECGAAGYHADVKIPAAEYNEIVQEKIDGGMDVHAAIRDTKNTRRCSMEAADAPRR